jgi:hypothetical protein
MTLLNWYPIGLLFAIICYIEFCLANWVVGRKNQKRYSIPYIPVTLTWRTVVLLLIFALAGPVAAIVAIGLGLILFANFMSALVEGEIFKGLDAPVFKKHE